MFKTREKNSIKELEPAEFPELLKEIPDPPKKLFLKGNLPDEDQKTLCVVGSRKYSSYGKEACRKLISGLKGQKVTIVSGLALGIDAIAHQAALDNGLKTLAVPGSGLNEEVLYPAGNRRLAGKILEDGGGLLSEFEPDMKAATWTFPQRNRIMAGLSHAVLIIEAAERSGTLITARLALDYNREVLVVPGEIFSPGSVGSNNLLKLGAAPALENSDILEALGLEAEEDRDKDYSQLTEEEKKIIELLKEPLVKDELIRKSKLDASQANIILSTMEIKGLIKESGGEVRVSK